jgi:hypothetical protein
MSRSFILRALGAAAAIAWLADFALGQQVVVGTPHPSASSSFYEQIGVQWGLRGRGWFFNFGGPPPVPQFGGFDPHGGASFGFGGRNGFFNITAGQGASTTFGSQTPMVTMPNGGFAVFSDQTIRPFVTSVIPVLGGEPPVFDSLLAERLHRLQTESPGEPAPQSAGGGSATSPAAESSAERGAESVAEIKARKAAERAALESTASEEVDVLVEKAKGALAEGKKNVARIYLQMASRRAAGDRRAEILAELERLK